ncbi:MAG: pyrroline-5-carboxylate reductase [Rivularia sp. (in: cyanobacteria)]
MTKHQKFGLIGGGVMGEALLSRLMSCGIYQPSEVIVSEPLAERRAYLEQEYNILAIADGSIAFSSAEEVVFLAIKPQIFSAIAQELGGVINNGNKPLVISILAGVQLNQLEAAFPGLPIVRAMPNTPATVGAGMTAICYGAYTKPKHKEVAKQLLGAIGEVVEIPEHLMDAVTGLSGSGPAYIALTIEALADGGVASGLPRTIANALALQTVLGTAQLLQESKMHPAVLKDRVTSPGGTTIAGITQLERAGFRSALIEAVKAAAKRSQELGS